MKTEFCGCVSRTIRAVTCTDSGCSDSCCILYTVLCLGGVFVGVASTLCFGSGVVDLATLMNDARDIRFKDFPLVASPSGGLEKKDDLRCATMEELLSDVRTGLSDAVESLFDFSAKALILCEIPDPTLIFLAATTTVSVFE